MQAGDMVYYLYTDSYGKQIKYAASVIACEGDDFHIRVGKLDVLAQKIVTFESTVSADKLVPRSVPCSFEDDLRESVN